VAASDPGGSLDARWKTMENFPYMAGKLVAEMDELMDGLGLEGDGKMGKEKFCTSLNLPGRPGLGIMESRMIGKDR
jgi:hypothetical protein